MFELPAVSDEQSRATGKVSSLLFESAENSGASPPVVGLPPIDANGSTGFDCEAMLNCGCCDSLSGLSRNFG